jgi:outer membrane protein OmpA-like peptidoglycan-associated protein
MRAIALASLLITSVCSAQEADTLIYAEGKVLNKATREPVKALISYQSLPYGNIVGQLTGTSYRFPFFSSDRYEITVEADGFAVARYMLDPAQAGTTKKVTQDVELGLPTSASVAANTAHTAGKVMSLTNLIFAQGQSKIEPASFEELDQVALMLTNYPNMVVQLEGHTDNLGNADRNMKLSEERVEAVKNYLVAKGANKNRIKTKAFGGSQPLSTENTEEAHRLNRRVQLRILSN